jgi:hypothetical protein
MVEHCSSPYCILSEKCYLLLIELLELFAQDSSKMKDIQKVVEMLKLHQPTPKNMDEARQKHYQFWDTQPVPKLGMCNLTLESI